MTLDLRFLPVLSPIFVFDSGIPPILFLKCVCFTDMPFRSESPYRLQSMLRFDATNNGSDLRVSLRTMSKVLYYIKILTMSTLSLPQLKQMHSRIFLTLTMKPA